MSDFLKISKNGQILEIILDRPKANALDGPSSREMGRVFAGFRDDPDLRGDINGRGAEVLLGRLGMDRLVRRMATPPVLESILDVQASSYPTLLP